METKDLTSTADVVRILGNDYVHAQKKYPEHDFEVLKNYMDIFVGLMRCSVEQIKLPPVERKREELIIMKAIRHSRRLP